MVKDWVELMVRCIGIVRNGKNKGAQLDEEVVTGHNKQINEKTDILDCWQQGLRLKHCELLVLVSNIGTVALDYLD